jgi:heme/copper-type cytochrome/quinol oxidase subunit 2
MKRNPVSLRGLEILIVILTAGLVGVLAVYVGSQTPNPAAVPQQVGTFRITLMEIMDTGWNSTVAQPQFSVVGPNGLGSSANIRVPVHTLIQLTVVSYDTPTPGSTDFQGKVSGTVGGTVFLINGTTAMGADPTQHWGQNVTSVPGSMLAHTFTIQQLGINVPVVGGDTAIAYLYFTQTGTFQWICATPCGFGPGGMQGAMSGAGWMEGQVTVY